MAFIKYSEHTCPDWAYWSQFSTLKIWEVAALMDGVDPRRLEDTTDANGDRLDLSDNERMLRGAVLTRELESPTAPTSVTTTTEISVGRLLPWLRSKNLGKVADGLSQKVTFPGIAPAQTRPVPRAQAQELAILQEIQRLGHDPQALPKALSGRAGVKASVKSALGTSGMWSGHTIFDKAWERLRADGRIADMP